MGKAAVLLVAGYSLLLLISGMTMSDIATEALDNSYTYYDAANVRNIAIAGANMAANYLFLNPPLMNGNPWWTGTTSPVKFGGGRFNVTVDSTTSVDPFTGERRLTLRSMGVYRDSAYTVQVIMRPSNFSKFAVYAGVSAAINAYWETGDSVFGPVHAQGQLKVAGRPYFGGKVTTKNGVDSTSYPGGPHHPILNAGLETGVSIPLNRSFQRLAVAAQNAGRYFPSIGGNGDLYLNFKGDSVVWHRGTNPDTTTLLATFAPNGAVVNGKGNIYVKGTIQGRLTVGALDSSGGTARGRIIVQDDVRYQTNPVTTPTSTDMLGLVAYNDVNIDGDKTKTSFTVQASMYAYKRGVTVEAYSTRAPGIFYTLGGWIVENVFPTSNGVPLGQAGSKGYKCNINFDQRYRVMSPPFFPTTGNYEILAWYE
jgi:hypothetical protein